MTQKHLVRLYELMTVKDLGHFCLKSIQSRVS